MRNEITYSQNKDGSMRRHRIIANFATYVILEILVVIWLYPILWIFLNAFRRLSTENGDLIGIVVSNYIPKQFGF